MIAARMSAAATTAPIAIPAMAPPESPDVDPPTAAPFEVAVGAAVELLVGKSGGIGTVVGSSTPTQRVSTFELTQQEFVELAVLSAQ